MKWSWKLGEFRGIAVYMHATFLILIGFVVLWVPYGKSSSSRWTNSSK